MPSFARRPLPPALQKLSPAQAKFCLATARFLKRELGVPLAGSRLLVGFSGGADSTALLLCLYYLAPRMNFSLRAAHLDHALRPDSAEEAAHCRDVCRDLAVPFFCDRQDISTHSRESGTGIEESARAARYAFFATAAKTSGSDWIVTGHNKNDLAEDILMRLIRGTGWPGLGGMAALDAGRRLLRPLLTVSRQEIENFLASLDVRWTEDASNRDNAYFRNRVRNTLLPLILQENPAFLDAAAGLWRLARVDDDFFEHLLSNDATPLCSSSLALEEDTARTEELFIAQEDAPRTEELFIAQEQLARLPQALRLRLYKKALAALGPGQALLRNLIALDRGWLAIAGGRNGKGAAEYQFPGEKRALVTKYGITWKKSARSRRRLSGTRAP